MADLTENDFRKGSNLSQMRSGLAARRNDLMFDVTREFILTTDWRGIFV